MKLFILTATILFSQCLKAQSVDSTDSQLKRYRDFFERNLINEHEYEMLKAKLLHTGKFSPKGSARENEAVKQYNRKTTFEVRIEPVAFFDLKRNFQERNKGANGQLYTNYKTYPAEQYGGMGVGLGGAIKKQYHIHFMMGFDGNKINQFFILGADFNANLLPGRFSPFIHAGGGYMVVGGQYENDIYREYEDPTVRGCYAVTGVGLYARLTRFIALNISPDYRFFYSAYKATAYSGLTNSTTYGTGKLFSHQAGLRVAVVFY